MLNLNGLGALDGDRVSDRDQLVSATDVELAHEEAGDRYVEAGQIS